MLRPVLLSLVASSVSLVMMPTAPVMAQTTTIKPATQDEVATYSTMGAVASCDLAVRQQVPLAKSLPATSAMVAYILSSRHGSEIQGVSSGKLNNEQLIQGSFIQIVGGVRRGCYDKLSAADKKEVDSIISQVEKAAESDNTKK